MPSSHFRPATKTKNRRVPLFQPLPCKPLAVRVVVPNQREVLGNHESGVPHRVPGPPPHAFAGGWCWCEFSVHCEQYPDSVTRKQPTLSTAHGSDHKSTFDRPGVPSKGAWCISAGQRRKQVIPHQIHIRGKTTRLMWLVWTAFPRINRTRPACVKTRAKLSYSWPSLSRAGGVFAT